MMVACPKGRRLVIHAYEIPFSPPTGYVSEETVVTWTLRLWRSPDLLRYLELVRGIGFETLVAHDIGWDGSRLTIPVRDWFGRVVNIRRYLPHAGPGRSKMISFATGSGEARLFPIANMKWRRDEPVLVCEGEWDSLAAISRGYRAVTSTGGAKTFPESWAPLFEGQRVRIVFDRDDAGREGARKVAETLAPWAEEVKIVTLPAPEDSDLSDFYLDAAPQRGDPHAAA